jgi:hypothetical protein
MAAIGKSLSLTALLAACLAASGCVSMPAPAYQPSISNTEVLLHGKAPLAVETMDAANGVSNKSLSVRGSSLKGGSDGTFSTYLQEALVAELKTAGRYGPDSSTRIDGTLVKNQLDGGAIKTGTAVVGARFVVTRSGSAVYDKTMEAQHSWDSSFIGAIAIPAAMENYAAAVQKLIGKLFGDPDFVKATQDAVAESE